MSPLTKFRKSAGLPQAELAKLAGTTQPTIQRLEKGLRGLSRKWAIRLAPHVGASPDDLMFGDRDVPLVGYVGAGSEAHFYSESQGDLGRAKMPPGGSEGTVAVQIRGDSLGAPFEGWIVYYSDLRDPPTDDLIDHLCIVELMSGQVLIKKIMRGRLPGHFDLWPVVGAPMTDQVLRWGAKVTAMMPPDYAKTEAVDEPEAPLPVRNASLVLTADTIMVWFSEAHRRVAMPNSPYLKEMRKVMTATSPARPCAMTDAEIETAIADISAQLKGPLSNFERFCLVEEKIELRKILVARTPTDRVSA
jgi:DNA-binding XRE family transcriptional regulator